MVALILIAYAIILMAGETLRSRLFPEGSRKYMLYSGSFVFLKLKPDLSPPCFLRRAWLSISLFCCPK
jgi:hypothetical protein